MSRTAPGGRVRFPVGRVVGFATVTVAALLLAACDPDGPVGPTPPSPTAESATQTALRPVTVALPFRPDVQFAPLYLAQQRGYFADEGLEVTFEYGDEAEQVRTVARGAVPAMIAGGDQVILARAAGLPVSYVMTWFQRFPVAVFALGEALKSPQDLVGKEVGLPANSGTSFLGWQALLLAAGIKPEDVRTEVVGFTQASAVAEGTVDSAVGYVNNEPLQLRKQGHEVSVLEIADTVNLVSNGLVVGESTINQEPQLVQGLVNGMLRGIAATLEDPDAAFDAVLERVPETADPAVRDTQREVLDASLPLWRAEKLGAIDGASWEASQATMQQLGLIESPSPLADLVDDRFVAAADAEPGR